ncbi:MAG: DUF3999 domain-containing protein [Proteobacteria bacterium]|nr:DUF3999 domain-containing protein [Pseudomonadota bacterium]
MKRVAAWAAGLLLALGAAHADETARYAYAWPLTLSGDSAAWQVELPIEVYQTLTDPQLRDLVVVDELGNAVPTAARTADPATPVSARVELPLFALPAGLPSNPADGPLNLRIERDADGNLRSIGADLGTTNSKAPPDSQDYLIDASKLDAPIDRLRLDWDEAAGPINAQFSLAASDDLQNWRGAAANVNVLGLAQDGNRLELHEIGTPGVHAKYLRLHRRDRGAALPGLRVSAITAAQRSPARAAREWLALTVSDPTASGTPMPAGPEYRYALPAALPIVAIKLDLAADNSVARVGVASRRSGTPGWTPRADFTAFRLPQGGDAIVNDETTLTGAARDNEWRVQSATPLNRAPTLNLAWRPDRFVFLGDGKQHYRLVAGSATTRRADYPVDVALAQLRAKLGADWQPPLAALGVRQALAGDAALQAPVPASRYNWKTFLLWGVLVTAAVAIGCLALSLLRGQKSSS